MKALLGRSPFCHQDGPPGPQALAGAEAYPSTTTQMAHQVIGVGL